MCLLEADGRPHPLTEVGGEQLAVWVLLVQHELAAVRLVRALQDQVHARASLVWCTANSHPEIPGVDRVEAVHGRDPGEGS